MDSVWNVAQYITVQNDKLEVASFPDSKTATSWTVDLLPSSKPVTIEVPPF